MTDTELFEIVKGHREAWPEMFEPTMIDRDIRIIETGTVMVEDDDTVSEETMMLFEASFHRALLERGDVFTEKTDCAYHVQHKDHDFFAFSLIEAYAKALEWLK